MKNNIFHSQGRGQRAESRVCLSSTLNLTVLYLPNYNTGKLGINISELCPNLNGVQA